MKKPKLQFKEVFIVDGWATEIEKGIGVYFDTVKEGICDYSNCWLVWVNGSNVPERIYENKVFTNYQNAIAQLNKEKTSYKAYLEKQIKECSENLKKL
jgi:hypothetical protein